MSDCLWPEKARHDPVHFAIRIRRSLRRRATSSNRSRRNRR